MDKNAKTRLKNLPKTVCSKCGSKRCYTNPMGKCFLCKKKYFYDHITGGVITKEMDKNDEVRNYCDDCL